MEAVIQVRNSLAAGDTPNNAARALIVDLRTSPVEAIKALREGGDMSLSDAKEVVHPAHPGTTNETA